MAEIEAVVVKCTLILYFRLSPCIKLPKVWFLSAAALNLVLVLPAFSVDPWLFDKGSYFQLFDKMSSIFLKYVCMTFI